MVITIDEELYDTIKGNALRNKSRSSIIYLPDDNENMRRYKVNLDINNNLYIMKDMMNIRMTIEKGKMNLIQNRKKNGIYY